MSAPLEGVRVIDAASFIAAPTACTLLAQLGADVIKVEPPSPGPSHAAGAVSAAPLNEGRQNANHGKRSIALDLTTTAGRDVLMRLCDGADVLVHNNPVSRAERFGLTYETVHMRNPRIVHATLSAFGSSGPEADRLGYDSTSFWAQSGIQASLGDSSGPPVEALAGMGDRVTALNLTIAVLSALRLRDATGEGQRVDVALQQTGAWVISGLIQSALRGKPAQGRPNRSDLDNPLSITYTTRDGRWMALRMVMNLKRDWPVFCNAVGLSEWLEEFPDASSVAEHANELRARVEALIASRDLEHWRKTLDPTGLMWAPVLTTDEVAADPQMRAIGAFEEVSHPTAGNIELISTPFRIDGADLHIRRVAPEIGDETAELLSEVGCSEDETSRLAAAGAFGGMAHHSVT